MDLSAGPRRRFEIMVDTGRRRRVIVLRVEGELDVPASTEFEAVILLLLCGDPEVLIIDLDGVTHLSLDITRVLIGGELANADRTTFRVVSRELCASRPSAMVGLSGYFNLYSTVDAARAA